jgi:hypothetical protein
MFICIKVRFIDIYTKYVLFRAMMFPNLLDPPKVGVFLVGHKTP